MQHQNINSGEQINLFNERRKNGDSMKKILLNVVILLGLVAVYRFVKK